MFSQVRRDLCFPDNASALYLYHKPERWDEALELGLPIFISSVCGPWEELLENLTLAGLSDSVPALLAESGGRVVPLSDVRKAPEDDEWALVLYWDHPEAGWRWRLPLAGRRYAITREAGKAAEMTARLETLGARATALPTISFTDPDDPSILDTALARLPEYDWIVFTSPNGVRSFFERLNSSEFDHRALARAKFACIGPSTAKALEKTGFCCDLLPGRYIAEGLLEAFEQALGTALAGLRILIPRAQEAREILPDALRAQGAEVIVAPAYKTVSPVLQVAHLLHPEQRVLFTSSSTVRNWVKLTGNTVQPCFCIGPVTAQTALEHGLSVLGVARVHTIDGLLEEVIRVDGHNGRETDSSGAESLSP